MSGIIERWPRSRRAIAALWLIAAPVAMARGDEPAKPSTGGAAQERAREILDSLRELQASVLNEANGPGTAKAELPARPAKSVRPTSLDSAQVDAILNHLMEATRTKPSPIVGDEAFVRRAYLDVTGKLPSPEAIEGFCRDDAKDKRAALIDRLLASPDYARNWARYWRDVIKFHMSNPNPVQVRFPVLEEWLADRLARNVPWDEVATALITGAGRNDKDGPANFAIAQMGEPVEMAGEVSRVFMGVQIQCAQCHDHPTDPWTRRQFHEFAAFFAGLRPARMVLPRPADGLPVFEVAVRPGRPRYAMTDLKDPQVLIPIQPRFFLAASEAPIPAGLTSEQRRQLAASFVVGQDNPWFARAFVNRVWYALIGSGFYNPVDDIGPTRDANAPEVLDALASEWQAGGYDVRWLFRTILNTQAYQREVRAAGTANQAVFASNCPVRLRSDQLLDVLVHALNLPIGNPQANAARPEGMPKAANQVAGGGYRRQLLNPRNLFNFVFGVDPSTPNDEVLGTIPQALFLMNSPQINRAIRADEGTVLGEILRDNADDGDALQDLYLQVLARRPNDKELGVCAAYIKKVGDRKEAFEDILWNLINSTEFLSRR